MRWQGGAVGVAIALLIAFASLLLMGFGLGELIRLTLSGGDLRLERHLAANPGVLRTPMQGVTYLGSSVIVLTVMAVAAADCVWNSRRREALMLVVVVAGAFLLYTTIKDLVDRPRPPVPHLANAGGASFPSGHSTQAAAIYGALAYVVARHRPRTHALLSWVSAALLILMISWSRLFLGVHYPSDVAGGVLIGTLWAAVTVAVLFGPRTRSVQKLANRSPAGSGIDDPSGGGER